ncbi:hypothetical protein FRB99_007728 [Tulasnella sp. 403]|nr:hypothetical protein FRB99_007728 [Tulasnella sp. 403]
MTTPPQTHLPILHDNPYAGHPDLTPLEADVLWEYAKMAVIVKQLATTTRNLGNDPSNQLLAKLRIVERQMGLVLTLVRPHYPTSTILHLHLFDSPKFKASVWSTIVTAEAENPPIEDDQEDQDHSQQQPHKHMFRADNTIQDESYYDDGDVTPQAHRYR